MVLEHWLASEFEGGRSAAKVDKMNQVDARYRTNEPAATDLHYWRRPAAT